MASDGGAHAATHLKADYASLLALVSYVISLNPLEAFLFVPTALFLLLPEAALKVIGDLVSKMTYALFGPYTMDGKSFPVSLIGYFDNKDFQAPLALQRPMPAFPAQDTLSLTNIQVFQKCTVLAYEEWDLVKAALTSWRAGGQSVEWVAGYEVHSVEWTDQKATNGNRPDHHRVELDTTVFIAKIGNAAVVSFKGTNPWTLADWMVDWNLYDPADKGRYGRVHPGFRTALGLDKDLMPLPAVRTTLTVTAGSEGSPTPSERPVSLYGILKTKLSSMFQGDPQAKIYVVGHSMGGALAAIFAAALSITGPDIGADITNMAGPKVRGVYTIGQPRVGDYEFAQELVKRFGGTAQNPSYIRIVNSVDIVPAMPPPGTQDQAATSYQHSGYLLYISPLGGVFPELEQPSITAGRMFLTVIISAFWSTRLWLLQYLGAPKPESPSVLFVMLHWASLLLFWLPSGVVQHIPANYSLAIQNLTPSEWQAAFGSNIPSGPLAEARRDAYAAAQPYIKAVHKKLPQWAQSRMPRWLAAA